MEAGARQAVNVGRRERYEELGARYAERDPDRVARDRDSSRRTRKLDPRDDPDSSSDRLGRASAPPSLRPRRPGSRNDIEQPARHKTRAADVDSGGHRRVSGSMRMIWDKELLPTQTAPSPASIPKGRSSTLIVSRLGDTGTDDGHGGVVGVGDPEGTESECRRTGSVPTGTSSSTLAVARSMRLTELTIQSTTHSEPRPPRGRSGARLDAEPLRDCDLPRVDSPDERGVPARRIDVAARVEAEESDRWEPADGLARAGTRVHSRERPIALVHDERTRPWRRSRREACRRRCSARSRSFRDRCERSCSARGRGTNRRCVRVRMRRAAQCAMARPIAAMAQLRRRGARSCRSFRYRERRILLEDTSLELAQRAAGSMPSSPTRACRRAGTPPAPPPVVRQGRARSSAGRRAALAPGALQRAPEAPRRLRLMPPRFPSLLFDPVVDRPQPLLLEPFGLDLERPGSEGCRRRRPAPEPRLSIRLSISGERLEAGDVGNDVLPER